MSLQASFGPGRVADRSHRAHRCDARSVGVRSAAEPRRIAAVRPRRQRRCVSTTDRRQWERRLPPTGGWRSRRTVGPGACTRSRCSNSCRRELKLRPHEPQAWLSAGVTACGRSLPETRTRHTTISRRSHVKNAQTGTPPAGSPRSKPTPRARMDPATVRPSAMSTAMRITRRACRRGFSRSTPGGYARSAALPNWRARWSG